MNTRHLCCAVVVAFLLPVCAASADGRRWENPHFESVEASIEAARALYLHGVPRGARAERLFVELNLTGDEVAGARELAGTRRAVVEQFVLTYPASVEQNRWARGTLEAFQADLVGQHSTVARRVRRFGYPELDGLVYLKLVDNVDRFAEFFPHSTDPVSRVAGVTVFCRYVLLPLSYISADSLTELDRAALRNPNLDRDTTLRSWQHESYRALINTFRHEMVHVHTNSALDVPHYSDSRRFPTWFHEGTATYLAGDPHAGLSLAYQEYQNLFFYLAERFGVRRLGEFWTVTRSHGQVAEALESVYGIGSHHELADRTITWHQRKQLVRSAVWIVLGGIVLLAVLGVKLPLKGSILLVLAATCGYGTVGGFAERVSGLGGPLAVQLHKLVLAGLAVALAVAGVLAVRAYVRSVQRSSESA